MPNIFEVAVLKSDNQAMRTALEAIADKITTSGKPRIEILNDCHSLARKALNEFK